MIKESNFEITTTPSATDLDFLTQKINEENLDRGEVYPFGIFVRDEEGEIIAGCDGAVIYGSIYTDQLWVHPEYRKKGLGKSLMERVHEYGRTQGCRIASVATMNFQAPGFYQKLGYTIDFSKEGYSKGSSGIFLSKIL